jgi:tight adherence protein B
MTMLAEFIGSDGSKLAIVLLTAGAVAAGVGVISVLGGRRQAKLDKRLAGYERALQNAPAEEKATATAAVQSAVNLTQQLASRTGLLANTEKMLEQADIPIRAAEVIFYIPVFSVLSFLLVSILFEWLIGLIAAALALFVPFAILDRRRRARVDAFDRQLPDTLTLIASSMRAGFSLMQALEAVAQEIRDPMRREMQRVFTEVRLGRPIEDALAEIAERMDSRDLMWTVMAIRIQREVGGNLAALLDTVANTITQRERLRREVKALTAEGRMSAVIMSIIPLAMAGFIIVTNPDYLAPLWDNALGVFAIVATVVAMVIGWFWLRKIVNIEA